VYLQQDFSLGIDLRSGILTQIIKEQNYQGQGTVEDQVVIQWIQNDPRNPFNFTKRLKWTHAFAMAMTVSLGSSAYASSKKYGKKRFTTMSRPLISHGGLLE